MDMGTTVAPQLGGDMYLLSHQLIRSQVYSLHVVIVLDLNAPSSSLAVCYTVNPIYNVYRCFCCFVQKLYILDIGAWPLRVVVYYK